MFFFEGICWVKECFNVVVDKFVFLELIGFIFDFGEFRGGVVCFCGDGEVYMGCCIVWRVGGC